ncbi:uncharacterized protein LOC110761587 isoform X2 [Prunus avium]|uniref:Uncharacterized protein LOC110761587 isoform X2 n=1 Tax=Prunus avium TaxID=42229 RepID=A0A6P5SU44_PRUAV|nr:uncharacterized protein LOC110761587 isoform X2 [Prunus avium]
MLWRFYHPPPRSNKLFASLLPAIFLLCLGGSKLSNNRRNANTTDNNILRKPLDSNSSTSTSTTTSTSSSSPLFQAQGGLLLSRWRAPRMRWTTTLLSFWVAMKGLHQSRFLSLWMSKISPWHMSDLIYRFIVRFSPPIEQGPFQNPRSGDQLSSAQTIHVQDNKDSLGNFFKNTKVFYNWLGRKRREKSPVGNA